VAGVRYEMVKARSYRIPTLSYHDKILQRQNDELRPKINPPLQKRLASIEQQL
jgi:hypothetical protein